MVDNEDSNKNKFFGGRVGVIPTKGVEIGVSLLSGKSTQILGEDVVDNGLNLTLWGLDAEVHGEVWEVRGEYVNSKKQQIHDTAEGIEKEEKNAFYVQAATRLSIIPAGFFVGALTPWEAVVRYSVTTEKAHDAGAHDETFNTVSFGLNYYITDSAVAKLGYDVKNEPHDEKTRNDMLTAMLSIGF